MTVHGAEKLRVEELQVGDGHGVPSLGTRNSKLGTYSSATLSSGPICPPPKRYRIGELVEHTGLSRQTLHNYTRWGLIREVAWTAGGHRLYDESVSHRLACILELKRSHRMVEIRRKLEAV